MTNRQAIYLVNRCFEHNNCTRHFRTPQNLREHLKDIHQFSFPVRIDSTRRYHTKTHLYVRQCDSEGDIQQHFACPCCTDHFEILNELASHFHTIHKDYVPQQRQQLNKDTHRATSSRETPSHDDSSEDSSLNGGQQANSQASQQKRSYDEALSFDSIVFQSPTQDRLLVDQFDVSQAFYNFQSSMYQEKWKLPLEQNIRLALAMTSVLLITPNKNPDDLQEFFADEEWTITSNKIQDIYDVKRKPMPLETISSIMGVVDNLLNNTINREEASIRITKLPLNEHEHKFARAISGLILKLMPFPMDEDVNEAELCSRFIDPFLTGIFDDPDQGVCLRWTNESTIEAKTGVGFTTSRPDLCITKCCGVKWKSSLGYGEAKASVREQDHYVLCKDLLKVAIFCKDSLDNQLMQGILGIQIIGRTIRFYLLALPAKGLYVMLELATIKVPDSLQTLPSFIPELPNILKVLDVFHRICVPDSDADRCKSRRAPTLSIQNFNQLFTLSKNRKKPCHLKQRHN